MKNFDIVGKRNWFFAFSLLIILTGFIFGKAEYDIDFIGGTTMDISMNTNQFNVDEVKAIVTEKTGVATSSVLPAGVNGDKVAIRIAKALNPDEAKSLYDTIKTKYNLAQADPDATNIIEPLVGKEIRDRGLLAVAISSLIILIYVTLMFSKMGGIEAGLTAIMALIHDILILLSVYLIGHIPINAAFIAAALTILGYSMNDTIIVYDRIRENEKLLRKVPVAELVNTSIIQTLGRTINTVLTVVITVTTLYIFGYAYNVGAIKEFTLPLLIGIISGSYSSIFIASGLYVMWNEFKNKKEKAARA